MSSIGFRQISAHDACCRWSDGGQSIWRANVKDVPTVVDCGYHCLRDGNCSFFSHSDRHFACMLCVACRLPGGVGHYTSWQHTKRAAAAKATVASQGDDLEALPRCMKGTLACLSSREEALPHAWQVATPYVPQESSHANATHALLDTLLETVSIAIEEAHQRQPEHILGDRTWWGMGMVGNKFTQANAYFQLVRDEALRLAPRPLTICEIGLNGGHSAVTFLEAAGRSASLQMFDLGKLPYTATALRLVHRLYPGQMTYWEGHSNLTVPKFAAKFGRRCDVMSIDGGHTARDVARDLRSTRYMSKRGALLLLDDMTALRSDLGRPVVEKAAAAGLITGLRCVADSTLAMPRAHRFSQHGAAKYIAHAWCHARFGTQ